ncbi:modifier of mdg4-like isoform X11 [Anopheles bellator]|uniref:modifier of mdg4-like isoform X11 n=1 Tax=Anopheles bellator TaxID=139047 RepID=UPI002648FB67|nr:modifier of mdg4-like isoform X11 [Anopheles bellator]
MADDEQFSLCWNNFNTNLSAGFHESLVQGDLVDVTLAAEGQLVKAHRLILSVCSPYFRKMFTQMPVNQHAFIFLKDVSHSALKDLIQFMYCGEVNVKQDALPAFISTAEALQIKGLTETGDSAPPPQPSPAKENIPTTPAPVSISTNTGSPRGKVQRSRVQSYKLESEESGDDKIVQIQSSTSHHSATGSQQAQQIQQVHVASGQKRILGQRILAPSMTNKRAKLSVSGNDMLDPSEATTQIQTVQIVKQLPSQTTEPEYVEMALEPISTKAEPDYSEEHTEIETVEAETEQDQSLAEHDQSADQEQGDDEGTYVEDEAYGDMSKYEESYFTEGEEGKAGVSGFAEPYTSDGTGNEQAAQGEILIHSRADVKSSIYLAKIKPLSPNKMIINVNFKDNTGTQSSIDSPKTALHNKSPIAVNRIVPTNEETVKMHDKTRPNPEYILKQLSNGHALMELKRKRVRGYCVNCIKKIHDPLYKEKLPKIITYCSACACGQWTCEKCFDEMHNVEH